MSTLTAPSSASLLEHLLAEGRSKLAARRRAWEEEEELLERRQEQRRQSHWQNLRNRVCNDLGEAATALAVQIDMPEGFDEDAPLAEIAIAGPGIAPLALLYGYGEYWERCCWDVAGGRFPYAVPTYHLQGQRVERNAVRDWHCTGDLAEALALAEEVEHHLVRLRREAKEEIPF